MAKRREKRADTSSTMSPPESIPELFYGVTLDDDQLKFANAIWSKDNDIVFVNAKAGTGKTFVTTGVSNLLVKYGMFEKIIYIMSPYGEKKQGWLPGSIEEKSSVYFDPFVQACTACNINPYTDFVDGVESQKTGSGYIVCITDTFLRGQNLDNAVVIVDEAQNFTLSQLKKVLTRIGDRSKVVVIGHTKQCDLDDKSASGFDKYLEHFRDQERAAVCTLSINHRGWISRHADNLDI